MTGEQRPGQHLALLLLEEAFPAQDLGNANIAGPARQLGFAMGPRQDGVLHHKFNIDDTAGDLFWVKFPLFAPLAW